MDSCSLQRNQIWGSFVQVFLRYFLRGRIPLVAQVKSVVIGPSYNKSLGLARYVMDDFGVFVFVFVLWFVPSMACLKKLEFTIPESYRSYGRSKRGMIDYLHASLAGRLVGWCARLFMCSSPFLILPPFCPPCSDSHTITPAAEHRHRAIIYSYECEPDHRTLLFPLPSLPFPLRPIPGFPKATTTTTTWCYES